MNKNIGLTGLSDTKANKIKKIIKKNYFYYLSNKHVFRGLAINTFYDILNHNKSIISKDFGILITTISE